MQSAELSKALNTRNNGKEAKLPKARLVFARHSFDFLGAFIFNLERRSSDGPPYKGHGSYFE